MREIENNCEERLIFDFELEAECATPVETPYGDSMSLTEINSFIGKLFAGAIAIFTVLVIISL